MVAKDRRRIHQSKGKGKGGSGAGCLAMTVVVVLAAAVMLVALNVSFLQKSFREQYEMMEFQRNHEAPPNNAAMGDEQEEKERPLLPSRRQKLERIQTLKQRTKQQQQPKPPSVEQPKQQQPDVEVDLKPPPLEHHDSPEVHLEQQKEEPEKVIRNDHHHLIFSTSCDSKQDWQGYLFFYQAMIVGQDRYGNITRIVSGCDPMEEKEVQEQFDSLIQPMSKKFHLHFTPQYGKVPGKSWQLTKYWNKPFGIKHFLEHVLGFPDQASEEHQDTIIILVDPDMLLLQPIVNDFSNFPLEVWTDHVRHQPRDTIRNKVAHGKPIAQLYGFGNAWLKAVDKNLTYVVGPDSPVHKVGRNDASLFYPAGPPYMMTAKDFYRVAILWAEFLPRTFDASPQFMSEMYAYSLACAHLELPHQLARGFMVSNAENGAEMEGWYFLKDVYAKGSTNQVCASPETLEHKPLVFHLCQRYSIGEFFFSKYKYPATEILKSCHYDLLQLPPEDSVTRYNYSHFGDGSVKQHHPETRGHDRDVVIQNAYAICTILQTFNKAGTYYRDNHCEGKKTSYNQSWNFFEWEKQELEYKEEKKRKREELLKKGRGGGR